MGLSNYLTSAAGILQVLEPIEERLYWVWSILVAVSIPLTTIAFIYYALMLVVSASNEKKATQAKKGIKRVLISWLIIGGYFAFRGMVMWLGADFGAQ